ncbi:MAG: NAD(P)/FAD-dependent oxidoreductase [Jatrophihabitantaceae bacterium]
MDDNLHRVVIIGSGFGGLFAAMALKHARDVQITMIDRTTSHLFQPLLYQVATGVLSQGEIAPTTRDVLKRHKRLNVRLGEVADIDLQARTVTATILGHTLVTPYDSLIVAAGAGQSYFGHDEYAVYAPGLKSIDDALELRARIFGAFEMAEVATDPEVRDEWLTFVVVGAGATGVEMAGQIAELAHRVLPGQFRHIDTRTTRVVLVDGGPHVLPAFGHHLSKYAMRELLRLGVEVHTDVMVTGVDATGVDTKSDDPSLARIPARTKVWAAGVAASPLAKMLADASGAETDRSGRIKVQPDCTLPGHPEVFAIGDMMSLDNLPGVAEVAMQQGIYVSRMITRELHGKDVGRPFRYRDLGSVATVARYRAVASVGPLRLRGFLGWLVWLVIHLVFLTGFKNRISALFHWTISFVGRSRSERTITLQQVLGPIAARQASRPVPNPSRPSPSVRQDPH